MNKFFYTLRQQFRTSDITVKLIAINIGVFLALTLLNIFARLAQHLDWYYSIYSALGLPASVSFWMKQPWSLLTYMFTHVGFFHLLFNMLLLYVGGRIIQLLLGAKPILPLYLYGGIIGAFFYLFTHALFSLKAGESNTMLVGASASVMAVLAGAATLAPDYQVRTILGTFALRWVCLFLVAFDIVMLARTNLGGSVAHLGGALLGYIFVKQLQMGNNWEAPFTRFVNWLLLWRHTPDKAKVVKENPTKPPKSKDEFSEQQQARIDAILDKIRDKGYDQLSAEEKRFLFELGNDKKE